MVFWGVWTPESALPNRGPDVVGLATGVLERLNVSVKELIEREAVRPLVEIHEPPRMRAGSPFATRTPAALADVISAVEHRSERHSSAVRH
jgi:hypothetical protein